MNVQALKTLYVALGGKLTDIHSDINGGSTVGNYTLISDVILAIAKKAAAIEGLPAVTTTENGKIMKVVEGKWSLADDEIQA